MRASAPTRRLLVASALLLGASSIAFGLIFGASASQVVLYAWFFGVVFPLVVLRKRGN